MNGKRTRGWYLTRIELAIGIGAILLYLAQPASMGAPPPQWSEAPLTVAGYLGMLVGLAWMIRIFRGPRDEPPRWRYRDR
jgi:hypothetical protein